MRMLTKKQAKTQGGRMLWMEIRQKPGLPEMWLVGSSIFTSSWIRWTDKME